LGQKFSSPTKKFAKNFLLQIYKSRTLVFVEKKWEAEVSGFGGDLMKVESIENGGDNGRGATGTEKNEGF
jgi:hypothetical protein